MNEKTRTAIVRHGNRLLSLWPDATEQDPIKLCKKLRRIETEAHYLAVDLCNGTLTYEQADHIEERLRDRITRTLGDGPPVMINRDPRGFALKIPHEWMQEHRPVNIYSDWGGYGIIAPDLTR